MYREGCYAVTFHSVWGYTFFRKYEMKLHEIYVWNIYHSIGSWFNFGVWTSRATVALPFFWKFFFNERYPLCYKNGFSSNSICETPIIQTFLD